MADAERIKRKISEIANRRRNVTAEEIEWVVNQLREYYQVSVRQATHGTLFTVGSRRFMICTHNPGSKQVKRDYVDSFIDEMIELGWYED